jgi:hypothetical protein
MRPDVANGRSVAQVVFIVSSCLLSALVWECSGSAASLGATGFGITQASSGSWGIVPTTSSSGTPADGSLTLNYSPSGFLDPPPQYFNAYDSGTIALAGSTYDVDVSGVSLLGTSTLTLTACLGAIWNTTLGTCGGTLEVIGSWTPQTSGTDISTSAVPASSGGRLSIQAAVTGDLVLSGTLIATVSISVSSSPRQIRQAITTNS